MSQSVVERLLQTNPSMEVWWDSSPLVFDPWVKKMVSAAPPEKRAELEAQVKRLFIASDPARSVFRGCTTNPPLSLTAVKSDPAYWNRRIDELIAAHPGIARKGVVLGDLQGRDPAWRGDDAAALGSLPGPLRVRLRTTRPAPPHARRMPCAARPAKSRRWGRISWSRSRPATKASRSCAT